jgi:putative oxidoreductase
MKIKNLKQGGKMATASTFKHQVSSSSTIHETKLATWAVPIGRTLLALIFVLSGLQHFTGNLISYAEGQGVPLPILTVPLSGLLAVIGGLSIMLGYKARIGGLMLILFLVPVTLIMHNFWAIEDAAEAGNQMVHFMKNVSMLGGAILIASFGAGPISMDHRR